MWSWLDWDSRRVLSLLSLRRLDEKQLFISSRQRQQREVGGRAGCRLRTDEVGC